MRTSCRSHAGSSRGRWFLPLVIIPLVVTVVGGLVVYWLTEGQSDSGGSGASDPGVSTPGPGGQTSTTEPPEPLSLQERLRGEWSLQLWTEAGGPVTLNIEARQGTLTITDEADVDWRLDIDERGETHTPQPAITCGGRLSLAGEIEAIVGGERNSDIDWTADLRSIDHSSTGENWIRRALCGWSTIGERHPYGVTAGGSDTEPATAFEMTNEYGTFVWERA